MSTPWRVVFSAVIFAVLVIVINWVTKDPATRVVCDVGNAFCLIVFASVANGLKANRVNSVLACGALLCATVVGFARWTSGSFLNLIPMFTCIGAMLCGGYLIWEDDGSKPVRATRRLAVRPDAGGASDGLDGWSGKVARLSAKPAIADLTELDEGADHR